MPVPPPDGAASTVRSSVGPFTAIVSDGLPGTAPDAGAGAAWTDPVQADTRQTPEGSRFDARAWNSYPVPFASPSTVCAVPEMRPLGTNVQPPLPRVRYCRS